MEFNLNNSQICDFIAKFKKDLIKKSGLRISEIEQLSKREFNELINTIYKNVIIDIDNIHLYYEFMSFDDVLINIELLNNVLFDRYFYILTHFKEIGFICEDKNVYKSLRDWEQIQFKNKHIKRDGYKYYEISFFDIKDTLKPIDEYIEEIKQSEAYKEYIAKKA